MKGKHRIIVQNKRMRYDFEIKRNITVIRGESATGKTVLVDMIREYDQNGTDSGIDLFCDKNCIVLEGRNWKTLLNEIQDSIVFIDEGNGFVASKEFAALIQNTDNYYVIVTRESLATLPYSVEEIYGIRNSGKYGTLKQTYNELYHLYGDKKFGEENVPGLMVTEDSNSGYQFFSEISSKRGISCISARGKSNVFSVLLRNPECETVVIADGAAFGSEIEKIMKLMKERKNFSVYLPESFEWMILKSGVIEDRVIRAILENTPDYLESSSYFSWEQFYTDLLVVKTENSYLKYNKHSLNPVYLHPGIVEKIVRIDKR